ncbi:unnamed protein product [Callosobruchus maculatus]|uniref:Uncharacterized protein n=2 Tax=Callosobruchus maculatus TaxID=64391 RepID=A0A653CUN2_CALMS|nr:unnamed protein product [Callosobruchus maculatus]
MNCLHIVGITGYMPLAELLNYHGAKLSTRDAMGRTPVDVAEQHKHYDLVLLYQTNGKGKRKVTFK